MKEISRLIPETYIVCTLVMLGAENGPITPTPHLTNVRLGVQTVPHGVALDKGSQLTV